MSETPGVTDKEIRIGVTMGMDGLLAPIGLDYAEGLRAAVEAANARGGIHGRQIKLIAHSDGYEPLRCVLNTRDLIGKESVFALTSYLGTPTSVKAQPIWTGAKVPVVGFYTGARALREPFNRYNFHVRASYYDEMRALMKLFAKELGVKRVAIFYQYDSFGQSTCRDTKTLMKEYGLTLVAEGSYPRNTLDVEGGLKLIRAADPDAVILIGTAAPLAKFIQQFEVNRHRPVYFGAASYVGGESFLFALGRAGAGCYVCQVMPVYERSDIQILKDYRRDIEEANPGHPVTAVGFEGYLNGRVVVEGLKRAGRRLTREKFISALEGIHGQPFGPGYEFSFGPGNHVGSNRVFMTRIHEGKYESLDVKN